MNEEDAIRQLAKSVQVIIKIWLKNDMPDGTRKVLEELGAEARSIYVKPFRYKLSPVAEWAGKLLSSGGVWFGGKKNEEN